MTEKSAKSTKPSKGRAPSGATDQKPPGPAEPRPDGQEQAVARTIRPLIKSVFPRDLRRGRDYDGEDGRDRIVASLDEDVSDIAKYRARFDFNAKNGITNCTAYEEGGAKVKGYGTIFYLSPFSEAQVEIKGTDTVKWKRGPWTVRFLKYNDDGYVTDEITCKPAIGFCVVEGP